MHNKQLKELYLRQKNPHMTSPNITTFYQKNWGQKKKQPPINQEKINYLF